MSTWIVAFLISGLTGTHRFVQLNGQWRVTIPTLAYRLAWQISIPVSLFSRDRKVRCKRAQAHVPLKDCEDILGKKELRSISDDIEPSYIQFKLHLLNIFVKKCINWFHKIIIFVIFLTRIISDIQKQVLCYANKVYFCRNYEEVWISLNGTNIVVSWINYDKNK